ncbi:glycosyltransferase family 2 protein [Halobacteriales archaeon Cl-PHB]
MYAGATIGVVVPAYNEESHVGEVVRTLPAMVDRAYVVDDGSTDGTWSVIQESAAALNERVRPAVADGGTGLDRRVVPIRHEQNRGVGGAIKTGYQRALSDGLDVVAVMGGDGQMDPDLLERVVAPVAEGRADYAKGNRLARPDYRADMPGFRYVGNVVLTYLTRVASGYWSIGDPQNGYTAISGDALDAVDLENMYEFYGYCNDLLVKLHVAGQRVVDVPMPAIYADETSHISYRSYVPRVSGMLFRNFVSRLVAERGSTRYPVAGSYVAAILLTVAAVALVLAGVVVGSPSLSLAVVVALVGLTALGLGVVCDRRADAELGRRLPT